MKLSIIVPVYNEKNTISHVLERLFKLPFDKEIIVVDDGSNDGTDKILDEIKDRSQALKIFHHPKNLGKGAAIRTAKKHIEGDVVIIQDADLEYDPSDIPKLLEPIISNKADAVFGSRFLGGPHRVLYFWHYVGNKFLTILSNMFSDLNLSDMETGYKAIRTEIFKKINIESNRFGFEPEITAKLAKLKCRIYEVPISYFGRTYEEGKKINWKDGIAAIFWIIKYNLQKSI